jgi:hypothetical protein
MSFSSDRWLHTSGGVVFAMGVGVFGAVPACSKREEAMPSKEFETVPEDALEGVARTNLDSPAPTKAQLERKERSRAVVLGMKLPWLESLPVVEDESTIKPRTKEEVIGRCLATELCAVGAEGRDRALALKLVEDYGVDSSLSPRERAFLEDAKPSDQTFIDFAWGYEHTHVLLWALGYLSALNAPNAIANVASEAALIRSKGPEGFGAGARLRALSEILDQNDLYYRLHWAVIDLRLKGQRSERAEEEIVMERHRALNWLIRYMNQEWDNVTTDT